MDLKQLREANKERVERLTKLRIEQVKLHQKILEGLNTPKTIPELSDALSMESKEIFWHVMALKKYNKIIEDKKCGDYVSYKKKSES